jgi:hypothetical protein
LGNHWETTPAAPLKAPSKHLDPSFRGGSLRVLSAQEPDLEKKAPRRKKLKFPLKLRAILTASQG